IVDFTNPDSCKWYASYLYKLMDMGIDCFKTDFGERIPVRDIAWFDGSDPVKMHNYYTQLYNKVVFDVVKDVKGEGEAILFARSATVGGQQFPVHWGGDNSASYISMAETLRAGLSMSHSGFGFWSHDISGFESTAPADVYKRWLQFGILSSHSRLHGSTSYRVPWLFDEESVDVCRKFVKLKNRLMPYLYQKAVEAHECGWPMMRPMILEFPEDPACDTLDRQYMMGDALLVAPIFRKDGQVQYYLPDGPWTSLLDGGVIDGGKWQTEIHDFMSLPLMVRPGTVLPLGAVDSRPDYDYLDGVELHVYQLEEGDSATVEIPDLKGNVAATFTVTMVDGEARVETDSEKPYTVILHN
ncbi:MAG: alpha-xylosidase, partial [Clostridia bacterium]|nr:alpha-xylosidase [Clostridia bacterium]